MHLPLTLIFSAVFFAGVFNLQGHQEKACMLALQELEMRIRILIPIVLGSAYSVVLLNAYTFWSLSHEEVVGDTLMKLKQHYVQARP